MFQDDKTDDAKKINETIIDTLALFDGIALYQSTKDYKHLFEEPGTVNPQDAAKTMQITLPVTLDSKDNNPTLINCYSGAYNKSELDQYLDIMEKQLGENSFSLILGSAGHVINLNYDAKTKHWLLIDPIFLPGVEYTDTGLLADALLSGYRQKEGLVMETTVYATSKHAISVKSNFLSMKKTQEWFNLHSPSKLNTVYDDKKSQLDYAVIRKDNLWIQQNISFGLDFNQVGTNGVTPLMIASATGDLDVVETLIGQSADIKQKNGDGNTALMYAVLGGHANIVGRLIKSGALIDEVAENRVNPTEKMLTSACYVGKLDVITTLINNGVKPTEKMLTSACYEGKLDVITTLINNGVKPTEEMLTSACYVGKLDVITSLINNGVKPTPVLLTPEMLIMACNENKANLINILIDNNVKPDNNLFIQVCDEGKLEIAQILATNISRDLIDTMGIQNTLEKIGVEKKIIDDSINTIISNAVNDMDERSIKGFNTSVINLSIHKHLNTLIHDQNSTLGQLIQKRDKPTIDAMLSNVGVNVVVNKFADFKYQINNII